MGKHLGSMFGHRAEIERIPDPRLPIPLGKVGIEVEVENCRKVPKLELWEIKEDHSLRNDGMEFVTNGPMYGRDIAKALEELFAHSSVWSNGYPRAGIHIHLDVRDLDFERNELARLVSNYMIVEHAMFAYAGEWRRCTHYCEALEDGQNDFQRLGKFLFDPPGNRDELVMAAEQLSKYQALNLRPLVNFGTVEFRMLGTEFDFTRVFNWIRVILALKRSAQDLTIVEPLRTLSDIGPIAYAQKILGETFDILGHLIDARRVWDAVTNATALMAFGNKFQSKETSVMGWDAPQVKPNPLVEKLTAKKAKPATLRKAAGRQKLPQ